MSGSSETAGGTGPIMSGVKKSAVLCMALGADKAAQVLQSLSPTEVELVTREIATTKTVPAEVVEWVLGEFSEVSRAVESVAGGGLDYARKILEQTYGETKAKGIAERIEDQLEDSGLTQLKGAAPEVLSNLLRGEHPQTIALVLAHLDVRQALTLVEKMDPQVAADVLFRVARMEKVSPETLEIVESCLARKGNVSLSQEMTLSGGPAAVAKVLNQADQAVETKLLEEISERNAELADEIRRLMFVFEDLLLLDGRSMQRLLREVEGKELALALKAASDELKQHIMKNMSERAASALDEEMEFLGPVRAREVEAAHARIIETVRRLEDAGEVIVQGRGGDDDVIV
jgi:flagellar motor switch protein FliG